MKSLYKWGLILSFSFFIHLPSTLAQNIESDINFRQYQLLLTVASERGWDTQHYLSSNVYNQLQNAFSNPSQFNTLIQQYTLQLVTELNRGRVTPSSLTFRTRIPEKKSQFQSQVAAFLSGQTDIHTLLQQVEPRHIKYQQQLHLLKYLLQTKDLPKAQVIRSITFTKLQPGDTHEVLVPYLQNRLNLLGYRHESEGLIYNSELESVVRQYQADHQLFPDGVIGRTTWAYLNREFKHITQSVRANLDRARWLPNQLEPDRIMVNLANQSLSFIENDSEVLSFKSIVGRLDRSTPLMMDVVKHVVLNPTWTVPYSIFINDKLPLIKKDPGYVARNHYRLINDLSGKEVDAKSINWSLVKASNAHYTLVQKPGKHNALGFIKFPLQNPNAIYLHDTNDRHLFKGQTRMFSSGCIRLEKPFELAETLLKDPQWSIDTLKAFTELNPSQAEDQTWLKTKKNIPVYLMYWTTFQHDDGRIVVLTDSYGIDREMISRSLSQPDSHTLAYVRK